MSAPSTTSGAITMASCVLFASPGFAADRTADSCAAADIQAAITDCVATGGGIVRVPACSADNTWGPSESIHVDTDIPFRLVGAGIDATVIGYADGATVSTGMFFEGSGLVELSDLTFRGSDTTGIATGIKIYSNETENLRLHHLRIQKFKTTGLYVCQNPYSPMVIDHCEVGDQTSEGWMYGIRVHGTNNQADFVTPPAFGIDNPNAAFIEDNLFDGCYHSVSGFAVANIVLRHNKVVNPTSYVDGHGPCFDVGCYRDADPDSGIYLYEIYDNDFTRDNWCVNIRGGTGIVTGNTFNKCNPGMRLEMESCSKGPKCTVADGCPHSNTDTSVCYQSAEYWWIWNNDCVNCGYAGTFSTNGHPCIRENHEYFLHAPTAGDPVSSYVPYPYPHPLVNPALSCSELGGVCCAVVETCTGGAFAPSSDCASHCCLGGSCQVPEVGDDGSAIASDGGPTDASDGGPINFDDGGAANAANGDPNTPDSDNQAMSSSHLVGSNRVIAKGCVQLPHGALSWPMWLLALFVLSSRRRYWYGRR